MLSEPQFPPRNADMQVVQEPHRSSTVVPGARDFAATPPSPRREDLLEDEIDFGRYLRVFGRHWTLLVVLSSLVVQPGL